MKSSMDYIVDKLLRPENIRAMCERVSKSSWEYVAEKLLQTEAVKKALAEAAAGRTANSQ